MTRRESFHLWKTKQTEGRRGKQKHSPKKEINFHPSKNGSQTRCHVFRLDRSGESSNILMHSTSPNSNQWTVWIWDHGMTFVVRKRCNAFVLARHTREQPCSQPCSRLAGRLSLSFERKILVLQSSLIKTNQGYTSNHRDCHRTQDQSKDFIKKQSNSFGTD